MSAANFGRHNGHEIAQVIGNFYQQKGKQMGVDVCFLLDRNKEIDSPEVAMSFLRSVFPEVERIWKEAFDTLRYAEFRKRFPLQYDRNWAFASSDESLGVSSSGACVNGPFGFDVDVLPDCFVFGHITRWREFEGDSICRRRLMLTANIIAKALMSSEIVFVPDSLYEGVGCVDALWDGRGYDDVLKCLERSELVRTRFDNRDSSAELCVYAEMKIS